MVPFRTLLGNIISKEAVCVNLAKVIVILNMPPPTYVRKLFSTSGHTSYYCMFIINYASITAPLEKLLKKFEHFMWFTECDAAFDTLKEKLSSAPILAYTD